ncbi:MAG: hypothetical protein GY841_22820 [FCB group bacterium]|nr:hypothetical protein [FCB group bacterium]
MKKTILYLTVLAFAFSISALAAPKGITIEDRIERMTEQLELTDEQVEQVTDIYNESEIPDIMDRMENADDRESRRSIGTEMRTEMDKVHEQIKEILTDEQKEKFEKSMNNRRERRPDSNRGGRGSGKGRG